MPLSDPKNGKLNLQRLIADAFTHAKNNGSKPGANSDAIIQSLALEIANAVHAYATNLRIDVTVQPGQSVVTSGGAGSTTSPGTGIG